MILVCLRRALKVLVKEAIIIYLFIHPSIKANHQQFYGFWILMTEVVLMTLLVGVVLMHHKLHGTKILMII